MPKVPKITNLQCLRNDIRNHFDFLICKLTSLKAPNNTPD